MTQTRNAGRCDSCEALMINGAYCHETGCPRIPGECFECGADTESKRYRLCNDCAAGGLFVAECWTCYRFDNGVLWIRPAATRECRAAGHDVREVRR